MKKHAKQELYETEENSLELTEVAAAEVESAGEAKPKRNFKKFFTAKNIAYFGILTALEVILLFFGSAIPVGTGGATLNFSLLPIVIGSILLGPVAGALMGLISGIIITIMVVVGMQGLVFFFLFQEQPFVIVLICLVKTTVAGLVSGLLYRLIQRKNQYVAVFVSALSAPIVNTGLFILGCLCISGAIQRSAVEFEFAYSNAFAIIILIFVTYNFFIEFAINLVFAPALSTVVRVVEKQFMKKKTKVMIADEKSEELKEVQVQQVPLLSETGEELYEIIEDTSLSDNALKENAIEESTQEMLLENKTPSDKGQDKS